jgi:hypothetical protein
VVVFNTGEQYSLPLGLTRVLQSDHKVGLMVAQQLKNNGFTNPLVISHEENLVGETDARFDAMVTALPTNNSSIVKLLRPTNSSVATVDWIYKHFMSGPFDSIVSLGGVVSESLSDWWSIANSRFLLAFVGFSSLPI